MFHQCNLIYATIFLSLFSYIYLQLIWYSAICKTEYMNQRTSLCSLEFPVESESRKILGLFSRSGKERVSLNFAVVYFLYIPLVNIHQVIACMMVSIATVCCRCWPIYAFLSICVVSISLLFGIHFYGIKR